MSDTVTDWGVLVPPVPVQVIVKVLLLAPSAGVAKLPLVACVPLQAFEAAQLVAFVLDQVSVVEPPAAMVVGLALILTVGNAAVTVTVADCEAFPPVPVHVRV
jgi:hypothetical protein